MNLPSKLDPRAAWITAIIMLIVVFLIYNSLANHKELPLLGTDSTATLPGFTDPKFMSDKNSTNNIRYYSDKPPTEEALKAYKEVEAELVNQTMDFCELYKAIDSLNDQSNIIGDARYPINPQKSMRYGEKWFEKELHNMLKDNGLSDKVGYDVLTYGRTFCPAKYK